MKKLLLWVIGGVFALFIIGSLFGSPGKSDSSNANAVSSPQSQASLALKSTAPALPAAVEKVAVDDQIKRHCKKVATTGGGDSYVIESGCIDMEMSAKKAQPELVAKADPAILKHCHKVSQSGGGGSYTIENSCIEMELDARQELNSVAGQVESRILKHCDQVARAGGFSYVIKKGCIDMEVEAKAAVGG